jgi:hypothetical protein
MTTPLEDRLQAHLADVAAKEPSRGPETDAAYEQTLLRIAEADDRQDRSTRVTRLPKLVAIAAAVATIALAAGLVVTRVEDSSVRTTPGGPDATHSPTTAPSPTTIPTPATSAPVSDAAPSALGTPTVIVGPSGPVGWWDGRAWKNRFDGVPPVNGGEQYQIVSIEGPIATGVGTWDDGCGISEEPGSVVNVDLAEDADWRTPTPMAVTGVATPQPRQAHTLPTIDSQYKATAVQVLAGLGIDDPDPRIAQVVAADLEGDGTLEVIVVAERLPEDFVGDGRAGDYSIAFVRRVVDGTVQTKVFQQSVAKLVAEYVYDIESYRIAAIADFNGDGRMEIGGETTAWEAPGTMTVHELRTDGTIPRVLASPC